MATTKKTKSKISKAKFSPFKRIGPFQALILAVAFSVVGSIAIYYSQAATDPWVQYAKAQHCPLNIYGVPPTLTVGVPNGATPTGYCTQMLKLIVFYDAPPAIANQLGGINGIYGPGMANIVYQIKKQFKLYNSQRAIDGVVDPPTWGLVRYIFLHGYTPFAYQPPPATDNSFGVMPAVSGKLNAGDMQSFVPNYNAYNSAGWCIINHESRSAGMYTAIQNSGRGPATGAFQFEGGYSSAGTNTWASFYGYKYAALAPPDVQWTKFFQVYSVRPSAWHGTGCPRT